MRFLRYKTQNNARINFDEETDQGDLNLYNKENLPAYY